MTPSAPHDPRCAIVRTGDIRAWCDCGAEMPVLNELRANAAEQIGASKERIRIKGIIRHRIKAVNDVIDLCLKNNVRVADVVFSATNELHLLLRELEQSDDETDD